MITTNCSMGFRLILQLYGLWNNRRLINSEKTNETDQNQIKYIMAHMCVKHCRFWYLGYVKRGFAAGQGTDARTVISVSGK